MRNLFAAAPRQCSSIVKYLTTICVNVCDRMCLLACLCVIFSWTAWGTETWMVPCYHKLAGTCFKPLRFTKSCQKSSKKAKTSTASCSRAWWAVLSRLVFLIGNSFFKEIFCLNVVSERENCCPKSVYSNSLSNNSHIYNGCFEPHA